jgi:polyisoprenoid-binding protein YceI
MQRTMTMLAALMAIAAAARAQAPRDSAVYVLSPASRFEVKTGKAGLMGFAGHEHVIRARTFTGRVVHVPGAPSSSRVEVAVPTDSLEVMTPPDTAEIRKVTAAMRTDVLDVAHFPEIRLMSKMVTATSSGFHIVATLTMHGRSRDVTIDVHTRISGDTLRAASTFSVNQSDYGITPYRGGPGGTVRVADRVTFTIDAVAVREGARRGS